MLGWVGGWRGGGGGEIGMCSVRVRGWGGGLMVLALGEGGAVCLIAILFHRVASLGGQLID